VRKDFKASAYFNPSLVTDAAGHAHASFKLPDNLTTFRIMAVAAAEDDRFGYAQDRVTVSRPLMARPAFPRFVRAGDTLDAGIVVTSKGLPRAKIDVTITAEGLTLDGDANKSIDLDANSSAEVRFALKAPRVGKAKVRFKIKGAGVLTSRCTATPPRPAAKSSAISRRSATTWAGSTSASRRRRWSASTAAWST
jgi:uncharacterized protein YfaS (alpha-2-macroglobulin family)